MTEYRKGFNKFFKPKMDVFIAKMKTTSFPGFDKIPIYDVATFFFQEIKRDQLSVRSSAISFNLLLAIFPAIIFLFTLIAYIPIEGMDNQQKNEYIQNEVLKPILPESGYEFLSTTIGDLVSIKRGGLLSIGFLLAFFFSTNGVRMLLLAFNKDHPIYKRRGFWRQRFASMRLTFYLFMLFIGSILLIIAGDHIVEWIGQKVNLEDSTGIFMLQVIQWVIILLLFFTAISLIYYYGPSKHDRWRFITPGATFATIFSILASVGFAKFVNNFGRFNEIYGSIATLIVLMVWLNINALVLLVGFEINNSIDVNRIFKQKQVEETISD